MSKAWQRPSISSVTASFSTPKLLREHLEAIYRSETPVDQVIVATSMEHKDISDILESYSEVEWILAGEADVFRLRALGTSRIDGQVVILTEDHCIWSPKTVCSYLEQYKKTRANLVGEIVNGRNDTLFHKALYYVEYGRYSRFRLLSERPPICAANALYKTSSLLEVQSVWRDGFYDNEVHDALALIDDWGVAPEARVHTHLDFSVWQAALHMRMGGRRFGSYRKARSSKFSKLLLKLGAWMIPAIQWTRLFAATFREGKHLWSFLWATPYILFLYAAWAWGEAETYWNPTGEP